MHIDNLAYQNIMVLIIKYQQGDLYDWEKYLTWYALSSQVHFRSHKVAKLIV